MKCWHASLEHQVMRPLPCLHAHPSEAASFASPRAPNHSKAVPNLLIRTKPGTLVDHPRNSTGTHTTDFSPATACFSNAAANDAPVVGNFLRPKSDPTIFLVCLLCAGC